MSEKTDIEAMTAYVAAEKQVPAWKPPRQIEKHGGEPMFTLHASNNDPAVLAGNREGRIGNATVSAPWTYYERWIDEHGNIHTPPLATTRSGVFDGGSYKLQQETNFRRARWVHYDHGPHEPMTFAKSGGPVGMGKDWPRDRDRFIAERRLIALEEHNAAVAELRGETDPASHKAISQLTEALKASGIGSQEALAKAVQDAAQSMRDAADRMAATRKARGE